MPVVEDGRVELTDVEVSKLLWFLLLSDDGFKRGMEEGINRALEAHGLTPTSISLHDGWMRILTEPVA